MGDSQHTDSQRPEAPAAKPPALPGLKAGTAPVSTDTVPTFAAGSCPVTRQGHARWERCKACWVAPGCAPEPGPGRTRPSYLHSLYLGARPRCSGGPLTTFKQPHQPGLHWTGRHSLVPLPKTPVAGLVKASIPWGPEDQAQNAPTR